MKRSEINRLIETTMTWLEGLRVHLPPFAYWTAEDWAGKGPEYDEIRKNMLGWDVTDYSRGNFDRLSLLLFTLRNGNLKDAAYSKAYAEKLLVSQANQLSTNHFHWYKMEDIINRGGGTLRVRAWNATENEELSGGDVTVRLDGCRSTVSAGTILVLGPGESITIPPRLYHAFWAEREKVMAWEVSMVNDDNTDNRFYEEHLRFTNIEKDEPARRLLCNECLWAK